MGAAKYYMGCHITRDRKACDLKLVQHLKSMVEKFDVEKASRVPVSSGVPTLSKANEPQIPEEKEEMSKLSCQETVGVLMLTATMT